MSDYDIDIAAWSEHQSALLRRRASGELINESDLDWTNIAEEIETLGNNLDRELASRIRAILLHLLKLQVSPAIGPRAGWRDTIREQREQIDTLLTDAPSRRPRVAAIIATELPKAQRRTSEILADYGERPVIDLDSVSYTEDQVLGPWLP